jgi:iron transport multicopper oxidase
VYWRELTTLSAFFNDITYVSPKVPTLYTVLSTGSNATNPLIYGHDTNSFVLAQNQVVEIILNNDDPGKYVALPYQNPRISFND